MNREAKGSSFLLAELHKPEHLMGVGSAYDGLSCLLTFDGKIPYAEALDSLTPFEQKIMEYLKSRQEIPLTPYAPTTDTQTSCVVIQEGKIGHVSILLSDEIKDHDLTDSYFTVGAIQFPPEEYKYLEDEKRRCDQDFLYQVKHVNGELQQMEDKGELEPIISNVRENLIHTGPVFVYVGHRIYSTFDRAGKNLVDRAAEGGNRLLSILPHQPVSTWLPEDQMFVYCVNLLLISGGSARLQEFSGGQLSLGSLNKFFDDKAVLYSQALGEEFPQGWSKRSLYDKAVWIGQKAQEVNFKLQRYRVINGLNIRWEEKILGERPLIINEIAKQNLVNRIKNIFGIDRDSEESDKDYWRRVTREVIMREVAFRRSFGEKEETTNRVPPLPLLIWSILSAAAETTQSDYAMSSTFRDVHKLIMAGPLNLDKGDFYCCVVPSFRTVANQTDDQIAEASQLMANRMEFNRWHFIPGDVERDDIPPNRGWLYPPTIPDIATEVDWHHGGHIAAKVHHSLRIPSSISVAGKEYRGPYDIRLLRQRGQPYQPNDFKTAKVYLDALGNVLNTVVESVEETNEPLKVDAFTTRWYRNHLWKEYYKVASI